MDRFTRHDWKEIGLNLATLLGVLVPFVVAILWMGP